MVRFHLYEWSWWQCLKCSNFCINVTPLNAVAARNSASPVQSPKNNTRQRWTQIVKQIISFIPLHAVKNIIYSWCRTCAKQYVGQTLRTIKERFQGHFYSIASTKNKTPPLDTIFANRTTRGWWILRSMSWTSSTRLQDHPRGWKLEITLN
jgi:hypothetical protein